MGLKLSGGVDIAYTQNFNNPNSNLNQLHIFDTDANGFMPHLAQVLLEKPAEAGGDALDRAGFRARLNFGLDARVTKARTNPLPGVSNSEFDYQELYVQYIAPIGNGLDVKFGKINTLIGYEVIQSWENPNFSRSFMFGLGQAFTTTGLRLTYQFNPVVLASVGVINGWDNVDDNNRGKSIEWLVALTPHERFGLSFYGSYGPEQPNRTFGGTFTPGPPLGNNPASNRLAAGTILTIKATDQDTIVLEPYYVNETNNPARASNSALKSNARWDGFAGYLIHDFTDQWSFRFRGEIFEDAGGARTCSGTFDSAGGVNTCFGATNTTPATPIAQTLWEVTPTLQYKPVPSLITRIEIRHDQSNKNVFQYGGIGTNHQETLSIEAIYLF
ncbi:MAG: porin [Nitrospirota bacterium]|nr:porin [Nitrospirota bacterium]MDE3223929.1 porin [Nitrospirota bacterium]MDE3243966.1 porin [Nitrospirota bacterium]